MTSSIAGVVFILMEFGFNIFSQVYGFTLRAPGTCESMSEVCWSRDTEVKLDLQPFQTYRTCTQGPAQSIVIRTLTMRLLRDEQQGATCRPTGKGSCPRLCCRFMSKVAEEPPPKSLGAPQ